MGVGAATACSWVRSLRTQDPLNSLKPKAVNMTLGPKAPCTIDPTRTPCRALMGVGGWLGRSGRHAAFAVTSSFYTRKCLPPLVRGSETAVVSSGGSSVYRLCRNAVLPGLQRSHEHFERVSALQATWDADLMATRETGGLQRFAEWLKLSSAGGSLHRKT